MPRSITHNQQFNPKTNSISLIRYGLETKDPYLAQVVRRVQGGEVTIEFLYRERNEVSIPTSRDSGWVRSLGSGRAKTRRRIV